MEESEDFDSFEATQPVAPPPSDAQLEKIGRYQIQRKIGMGGFGVVYLARDESLQRTVALKVINRGVFDKSEDGMMEEGRTLAQLDHPGIVTIHDIGKDNGRIYFVSAFVAGRTLRQFMSDESMTPEDSAAMIAEITVALGYAHKRSVVHRDIKPTNIIVTPEGKPILIDFGVALAVNQAGTQKHRRHILGTPSYMSPEQARGESHLVDGRSDIYSLGVILFEMLTKVRPFEGRSEDLIEKVASPTLEARPPRQINEHIPKAIERICLKALAKRTGDRYSTAQDLRQDLQAFLDKSRIPSAGETKTFRTGVVVPKGLRSFDETDSDFFLQLLPGLRDQAGIPDSIRFWQRGIENPVDPFRVGVLYGPSGSGKSSFLKAGLLPQLPDDIDVIFVAAVSGNTETVLRERLRDRFPDFTEDEPLGECIRRIRTEKQARNTGKLLIVIDQFEQWLHANGRAPESDLVAALRQCDGKTVQVLLTLRDDFWMAIGQLMEDIDVEMLQSENTAAIDLFDRAHAWRVLVEFGRAYERIPAGEGELSEEHSEFVRAALTDMEQDGKTIPLHLSLFAEMAKSMEWTRETYEKLGGTTAIGAEFLNSVFSSRTANPAHRAVEKPARAILEALLPSGDSEIRGRPLEEVELMMNSRLAENPAKFASTIRILDDELKLITPVDKTGEDTEESETAKRYQLTHDYLVPSLRGWLFESHHSTIRGRAFLRLNELSGAWRGSRDRRHLPSFWEWLSIRLLVPRNRFTEHDRKFMKKADLKNGRRAGVVLAVLAVAGFGVAFLGYQSSVGRAVDRVVHADIAELPQLLESSHLSQGAGSEALRRLADSGQLEENQRVNVSLALLKSDPSQADWLYSQLESLPAEAHFVVSESLQPFGERLKEKAWARVMEPEALGFEKLRQFAFLAGVDPENARWREQGASVVISLLSAPVSEIAEWCRQLGPVQDSLETDLAGESNTRKNDPLASRKLTTARVEFAKGDLDILLAYLESEQISDLKVVTRKLKEIRDPAISRLSELFESKAAPPEKDEAVIENLAEKRARGAVALMLLDEFETVWPLFESGPDNACRTRLIHYSAEAGVDPTLIFRRASGETSDSIRIALVQSLAEYGINDFSSADQGLLVDWIRDLFGNAGNPGLQASARWALTNWKIDPEGLPGETRMSGRSWLVLSGGEIMPIIALPEGEGEVSRFAIGATEVTNGQFRRAGIRKNTENQDSTDWRETPATNVSMEDAMRYCNWLSEEEKIDRAEWCYEIVASDSGETIAPVPDFTSKTGFRLPTLNEWRIAAKSGTVTKRYPGSGQSLISRFEWYSGNAQDGKTMRVAQWKPNDFGIFDVLGNVMELCHETDAETFDFGSAAGCGIDHSARELAANRKLRMVPSFADGAIGVRIAQTIQSRK